MRENGGGAVGTEKPTAFRPLGRRAALGLLLLSAWGAFAAPARVPSKLQLALLTKIFAQDDSSSPATEFVSKSCSTRPGPTRRG
ncbi:MAG: hypothetical protein IPH01_10810 [Elusimicrobia bacterium]|nr:hypothetical protein [Elusimicrobiota bacterium]